jgi:hypothetical protein
MGLITDNSDPNQQGLIQILATLQVPIVDACSWCCLVSLQSIMLSWQMEALLQFTSLVENEK